ncbi:uncharacterized protein LOC122503273 [Leptopilina heterotoma]|uniref:uncharacterized protein LOC122503273 n=1 Tax=Leptopilina heterotoma TaxID=63436 RepID=UPI001CA93578|nr:uncharacterized protein LOC122503273 [Leptopilina heterotoma]
MTQIALLSCAKSRPRCLIVHFSKTVDDKETFLRKMWISEQFLDVTIVEIIRKKTRIHQLNPFFGYKNEKFSRETVLFPDKLLNMNRYPLKVGIFQLPPLAYLKMNSTDHLIETFGKDSYAGKIFSQRMNFQSMMFATKENNFGRFSFNKNETTGLIYKIFHRQLQFVTVTSLSFHDDYDRGRKNLEFYLEYAKAEYEQLVALVPKLTDSQSSSMRASVFYIIPFAIVINIINQSLQHLYKLDATVFNPMAIINILLGKSSGNEPQKLHERIIFMTMIWMSFFFSSEIFAWFTGVNLVSDNQFKINSFKDLNKSNLYIGTQMNTFYLINTTKDQDIIAMVARKYKLYQSPELCLKDLIEEKNVACVLKQTIADWYLLQYNRKDHEVRRIGRK